MATDAELDAAVRRVLGEILTEGEPYTSLPMMRPDTGLLAPAVMAALDERYPDPADVSALADSVGEQAVTLGAVGDTVVSQGESITELEDLTENGRLSEPELKDTIAGGVESGAPTSEGLALRAALNSGLPCTVVVQGDSTGNAADEWVRLITAELAATYPTHRVEHRLWNLTTLSYDTPDIIQAGTESYLTPSATTDMAYVNSATPTAAITGDMTVRAKVRATDVDAATNRTVASVFGGAGPDQSWRLYFATGGLTLSWKEAGGTTRTHILASMAQLTAAFTDGVDFYIGCELDVDNGAGQYAARGLTSTDGLTWTTLGTPIVGSTGVTSVFASTGFFKPGARGATSGNADYWVGRVYWAEVAAGIGVNAAIKVRFEPGLSTRVSSWTGSDGQPWVKSASGITKGSPLLMILNSSASGMDAGYSVTHFATQAPYAPSLAVISYTHNGPTASAQLDYAGVIYKPLLDLWASSYSDAPVMVTMQNPHVSPRTADQIEDHARRVRGVGRLAAARHLPIIDAFTALGADTATYIQGDGVHPTAAGSLAWAEVARKALRPAIPA
jgi:hypothetical protein